MEIRSVGVEEFLSWPDDRPDDGDVIRNLIASGRSREEWLFVGYESGKPGYRIGYRTAPMTANPEHSGSLATTRVFAFGREGTANPDAYRALIDATLPDLPDDVHLLETRLYEHKHADAEARALELEVIGFTRLMEKVGYEWAGGPATRPRPEMRFQTLDQIGRAAFTALVARVGSGGLDREMNHYQAHMDIDHWAEEHIRYLGDRDDLMVAGYVHGEPVGLVTLTGLVDEKQDGLLAYVGVVPEQRGNGYVNDLIGYATDLATAQGWESVQSQTDMENLPTRRAFDRNGFTMLERSRSWGHMLEI